MTFCFRYVTKCHRLSWVSPSCHRKLKFLSNLNCNPFLSKKKYNVVLHVFLVLFDGGVIVISDGWLYTRELEVLPLLLIRSYTATLHPFHVTTSVNRNLHHRQATLQVALRFLSYFQNLLKDCNAITN